MANIKDVIQEIQDCIEDGLYCNEAKEKQYYLFKALKLIEQNPDYIASCDLGEHGKGKKPSK